MSVILLCHIWYNGNISIIKQLIYHSSYYNKSCWQLTVCQWQQIMSTSDILLMTTNSVDNWQSFHVYILSQSLMSWNICDFFFVDSVLICTDLEMNNSLALSVWFCIIFWGRGSAQRISKTEIKTFNFVFRYDDVGPSINCPKVHTLRFLIFI